MTWLLFLLLFVVLLAGLYINLVGAPGLWVMVLAAGLYAWATHGHYLAWKTLGLIILLASIAELIEFLAAGTSAKRAGAGKAGVWGAILGGVLGAIFLTLSLPIPAVGTILGVCLGTFLGAMIGESLAGKHLGKSLLVGVGAVKGRLMGMLTKLLFGLAILCVVTLMALPVSCEKPAPVHGPTPPTRPSA